MEGFSQAAENNKAPILAVLEDWLEPGARVLEVGSGAGQHALHFAASLPGLRWQPTERAETLPGLWRNILTYATANVLTPLDLDLATDSWPEHAADCVYAANVLHIVSAELGAKLISGAAQVLVPGGVLILYGPYKYRGQFTTPSNADFDQWLKARDQSSGVRDFEWVCERAREAGFDFVEDRPMPANNQMLKFRCAL
ncbi:MAG: DUF938 domain-containing protein [Pseudomonadota bacterium]|nr:DUF938 domain-containing protein [Pseudomonadota bacterium]